MKKIAIIGAGFFGIGAGLILSRKFNVDIYEKENSIFKGASSSNQLRFHLGYHYPRSVKTLLEVKNSNKDFLNFYGQNIFGYTKNYYGIAKKKTKTSYSNYIKFLKKNKLPFKKVFLDELQNVKGTISSAEKNINIFKIKKIIDKKIKRSKNINLKLKRRFSRNDLKKYDKIIIAAYENNNLILKNLGIKVKKKYKFELVEKTVVKLPKTFNNNSYMIIDGKFLCLDPYVGTKYHLLSSNKFSKIEIKKGYFPKFKSYKSNLIHKGLIRDKKYSNFFEIVNHGKNFLKFLDKAKFVGSFYLIRAIELNKENTDERLNRIDFVNKKIITLFSGKWNTSITTAKELLKKI